MTHSSYFDRDLSWLTFNYRVLEEAAREQTPLLERVFFLSIYCSNLDEFYRVRIPAVAALQKIRATKEDYVSPTGLQLLTKISSRINLQLDHFGRLLTGQVLPALKERGILFNYHQPIPPAAKAAAKSYFLTQVLAFLQPVHLPRAGADFFPENDHLYFLVILDQDSPGEELVILNIPSDSLPRFFPISEGESRHILFIDDIIRENLSFVFPWSTISSVFSLKISRDAELDLEDEYQGDIAEKIEKKLAKRDAGLATRLLYEPGIPLRILEALVRQLDLEGATTMEGGRYHNLRDLAGFPVKDPTLSYMPWPATGRSFDHRPSLIQAVMEKDILLHVPYETYDPVLRFFNEAAIHPQVEEIYVTLYRVAKDSRIVHALISASRNGKKVAVFVELKARFDEANNLRWAKKMKEAGVKIIYSIPGLKVHAKIGLVKKRVDGRVHYCGLLATGNLNENTARFYTDHILLTGDRELMRELELLFIFLSKRKDPRKAEKIAFQHLLVAQFNLPGRFLALIDREIAHALQGRPASIIIKMNNLEARVLIDKLYEASRAGVSIRLLIRGICCCVPGVSGQSENITIRRIVDRYLEHGRVFIFHNGGQEEIFLGSSDWMNRNIYRRIEVCFPLYDPQLKNEIRELIRLQLADTVAATSITAEGENSSADPSPGPATGDAIRSQEAIYRYLAGLRILSLLLFLVMGFIACKPDKPGSGLYIYYPVADGDTPIDTALSIVSFLQLRPDGSYTQDFRQFDYGKWTVQDQRLYLTNQRRRTYVYRVLSMTRTELDLRVDSGRTGHFRAHLMPSGQARKDPFSLDNNQWRIPATHKESDAEIRQRLLNHCQFWEAFFRWVDDKDESVVDVSYFPSPLKVYGNGFGLKHYDNLPPRWKSYFFDEEDCHRADTLIKHTFRRNKINWPGTKDDFKKLISGFQQLQQFLR